MGCLVVEMIGDVGYLLVFVKVFECYLVWLIVGECLCVGWYVFEYVFVCCVGFDMIVGCGYLIVVEWFDVLCVVFVCIVCKLVVW